MNKKAPKAKQLRTKASELLKRVELVLAGLFYCTYAHAETWVNLTGTQFYLDTNSKTRNGDLAKILNHGCKRSWEIWK